MFDNEYEFSQQTSQAPNLNDLVYRQGMGQAGAIPNYTTDMAQMQYLRNSMPANPGSYAQNYEQHRAIRGGLIGPGITPHNSLPRGGRGGMVANGLMGFPQLGGGMDSSSVQSNAPANAALAPYGLQLPTHTNPFLFFNDQQKDGSPTWAGNHPKVAKAIEGAMIGATTPGGETIGENISNVARTVLGIPGMYRDNQAQQMMAPFGMAQQIGKLQDDTINRGYKLAEAFHAYATGKAMLNKPQKVYGTQVYSDEQGHYNIDEATGKKNYIDNTPGLTPGTTKVGSPTKPGAGPGMYPKGLSTLPQKQAYDDYRQRGDFDPDHLPNDWNSLIDKHTSRNAILSGGGHTAGSKSVGQGEYGDIPQEQREKLDALKQGAANARSRAKENLKASDFANSPDPLAARNAEKQKRDSEAQSAEKAYQDAVGSLPSSRTTKQQQPSSPKGLTIHPDGRIELPPPR